MVKDRFRKYENAKEYEDYGYFTFLDDKFIPMVKEMSDDQLSVIADVLSDNVKQTQYNLLFAQLKELRGNKENK